MPLCEPGEFVEEISNDMMVPNTSFARPSANVGTVAPDASALPASRVDSVPVTSLGLTTEDISEFAQRTGDDLIPGC
eukprot:4721056-Prymnesium_polylepis.1